MNAICALYRREVIRFLRQRSRVVGALMTPLLFWLLVGGGLGRSFQAPIEAGLGQGAGYLEFFFPGILSLSVLFTAIFSTISVIEDRNEGFLQAVLVTPVSRWSILLAKVLGGASLALLQVAVLLLLAFLSGAELGLDWNWAAMLRALCVLFMMGAALTSLGFVFAWKLNSTQGYHSIMNVVLMPMWILSGAVFPANEGNFFFKWSALLNPLTYAMRALREALSSAESIFFLQGNLVMLLMLGACAFLSVRLMDSTQKS